MLGRAWHAAIAAFVLVAIVLQLIVAARVGGSPPEVNTGLLRGSTLAGRVIRVLSFFTIQSNILCGVVAAQLAVRPDRDGPAWRPLRLAALCGIAVTGIVYSAVLADIHEPHGAVETTVNTIVHYVVPIMMVLGWVAIEVRDSGPGSAGTPSPDAHGLVGMRERVRIHGGRLETGPAGGGGFRVHAVLPIEAE